MVIDWPSMAACRNGDPDALFVQGAEQNVAKRICRSCPVRYECLADALDNHIEFGVWGGMTERERRALLRRHPQVASWRKTFEAALSRSVSVGVTDGPSGDVPGEVPEAKADPLGTDRELVTSR
jgi:WhiB family redox-sensing transcriptional regulator